MSILNKIISVWFRVAFISLIIINYIYFVINTWYPICKTHNLGLIIVFIYHFLIVMLVWSILVTATTDPGKVPIYWGFYFGDSDLKRKRYCLMCNVFKPERCHHCSICNRCVLNMDHHCPWINNCVGFYNRKFFIQMLFYLSLTLLFTNVANAKFLFDTMLRIYRNRVNLNKEINETFGFLLMYFIDLVLNVIIVLFFKFHLLIVLENKTTIETIDKKTTEFNSIFDLGSNRNWIQVMGTNKLLWFFPIRLYIGMPIGNGIDWFDKEEDLKKLHNLSISTEHKDNSMSINTKNNNSQIQNNTIQINNNPNIKNINSNNIGNSTSTTQNKQIKFDEKISTNQESKNIFSNDLEKPEKLNNNNNISNSIGSPMKTKGKLWLKSDKENYLYNAPLKITN